MSKIASSLLLAAVQAYKVGVISDIHLNLAYNPDIAAGNCGQSSTTIIGDPIAEFSRYGCDSSANLVETMFTRFLDKFGKPDVLLIPGDHAAHGVAVKKGGSDPTGSQYVALKENIAAVYQLVAKYFPETIVLPTVGNNDGHFKDQAIDEPDKADYYSFLHEQWFTVLTGNKGLDSDTIKSDVLTAGYYAVQLPGTKYTVLNINSMYCDIWDEARTPRA